MSSHSKLARFVVDTHKLRVPVEELVIGMFVSELDRPWLESPFLMQGFELTSVEDIHAVRETCKYVYVDVRKERRLDGRPGPGDRRRQRRKPVRIKPKVSFAREMGPASTTYKNTSTLLKSALDTIRLGGALDLPAVKEAVAECVDSAIRNPDALMWLTQLKNKDEYTALHCLNVGIFSAAFARHLGMSRHDMEQAGQCALLHDVGNNRTPLEVLNKEGFLEKQEFEIMKQHAVHGKDILLSTRGVYAGAVDVAHAHHERIDGKGYPRGLSDTQIPLYAKLVGIVDAYDAITSDRVYQNGRTSFEAMQILNECQGTQFDANLVTHFIECVGIYPAGSVVEMSNGEVGIVIQVNRRYKVRPRVLLVLDEDRQPRKPRHIDLTKADLDPEGKSYRIRTTLLAQDLGLDVRQYLEDGLIATV